MTNFPIFVGEGNGGKSLFCSTLTIISGPPGSNRDNMLEFFKKQFEVDEIGELSVEFLKKGETLIQKLEQLDEKKLVYLKDFEEWDEIDGGLLKTIDGGESYYMRTDEPESGVMKTVNTKMVITTSRDPKLLCKDKSLLNRLNVVQC